MVDSVMMSLVEDFASVDILGVNVVIMSLFVVEGEALVDVVLISFSVVAFEVEGEFVNGVDVAGWIDVKFVVVDVCGICVVL